MKIAFADIEATGLTADGWDQMLCACIAEYSPEKPDKPWGRVRTFELGDYKNKRWDDESLALDFSNALSEYGIVVGWNSVRYDEPFVRTRLLEYDHHVRGWKRHKDLMYTAKFKLKLCSASLDNVSGFLKVPEKYGVGKTKLDRVHWRKAICGHRPSMDYIITHCREDVKVLACCWQELEPLINEIK